MSQRHAGGKFAGHRWIPRTKASDAELHTLKNIFLELKFVDLW